MQIDKSSFYTSILHIMQHCFELKVKCKYPFSATSSLTSTEILDIENLLLFKEWQLYY